MTAVIAVKGVWVLGLVALGDLETAPMFTGSGFIGDAALLSSENSSSYWWRSGARNRFAGRLAAVSAGAAMAGDSETGVNGDCGITAGD